MKKASVTYRGPRLISPNQLRALAAIRFTGRIDVTGDNTQLFQLLEELNMVSSVPLGGTSGRQGMVATARLGSSGDVLADFMITSGTKKIRSGALVGRVAAELCINGSDNTRLAKVDVGRTHPLGIMYGGLKTLRENDWVVVAPPNEKGKDGKAAILEGGERVRTRSWNFTDERGEGVRIASQGFLASGYEAGAPIPLIAQPEAWRRLLWMHSVLQLSDSGVNLHPGLSLDQMGIDERSYVYLKGPPTQTNG